MYTFLLYSIQRKGVNSMEKRRNPVPPPMGWNSWYCFSEGVSDGRIRQTAAAIKKRRLDLFGWKYINIDDCWQGKRGGIHNALQGNERFPDMMALGQEIHSLGLQYGLYSTPFIGTYAGFRGGSSNHRENELCIPPEKRSQPEQLYGTYPGGRSRGVWTVGEEWLFDNDIRQWCDWKVDFVKVDWNPIDPPTTKRIADSLKNCGREILLSLSNNACLDYAEELSKLAVMWRISPDITDTWESIASIAFELAPRWTPFLSPGHYMDLDILQIGSIGIPGTMNPRYKKSNLTSVEQQSHFALWCMYSAPLLLSCDIAGMDDETYRLVTNRELIAVDQDPLAKAPVILESGERLHVLKKELSGGETALCIVNRSDSETTIDHRRFVPENSREVLGKNSSLPFCLKSHECAVFRWKGE